MTFPSTMTRNFCISQKISFPFTFISIVAAFLLGFYGRHWLGNSIIEQESPVQIKRSIEETQSQFHEIAVGQVSNASIRKYLR